MYLATVDTQLQVTMPAFSFTAPHITPEQEREEKECLDDEIRQQIQAEMLGISMNQQMVDQEQPFVATAASEEALERLEKVIEKFPLRQKKEFLEAVTMVPHLVQTESEPNRFLRCEKGNVEVGADHYWLVCNHTSCLRGMICTIPIVLIGGCHTAGALLENPTKTIW